MLAKTYGCKQMFARPGDVLILNYQEHISLAQRSNIENSVRPVLELLGVKLLIIDGGTTFHVLSGVRA